MATRYRVFPPIGIARLGEEPDFFIGPERPGHGPFEPVDDGSTPPVTRFKDASRTRIRKQGARFHLFESEDGSTWRPAALPATARVTWRVALANTKSAVRRPAEPPIRPTRSVIDPADAGKVIDGGTREISGANAQSTPLVGAFSTKAANGTTYRVDVELGQLRTDAQGRLIVLGGKGFSSAPPGTPLGASYYRNPDWHDDVADGPVEADIVLQHGDAPIRAEHGAWVIVAPPDYAPDIPALITLHDVLRQLAIDEFGLTLPAQVSFDRDIAPIITRVRRLQWVHDDATWSTESLASPRLRSRAPADRPLRDEVLNLVLSVENIFEGHTNAAGPQYRLRRFQRAMLDAWAHGGADDTAAVEPGGISAEGLTQAALEGAVGQGFCPGIEAGILMVDPDIYVQPFDYRLDHTKLNAGDLTALMAQPWQADFLKCNTEWWPAQRPDLAPQASGQFKAWIRGAKQHALLVERSARLGFVLRQGEDEVFVEAERDPALPQTP